MSLASLCVAVLAKQVLREAPPHRVRVQLAEVDVEDAAVAATVALVAHDVPQDMRDRDVPLGYAGLARLQGMPDTADFSLLTLVSLPNCARLDLARLSALRRLVALDLRGCTVSSRALATLPSTRSRLRLLGLHGCPNVDDDVLDALRRYPLLSAVDLRFTRCTPAAVDAHLGPLGFSPSDSASLFHPAPLDVALATLENMSSLPLYSCPPDAAFRVHIRQLVATAPTTPAPFPARPRRTTCTLPLRAQAVEMDPLAVARPPLPWSSLPDHPPRQSALDTPLRIDRARLHRPGSDAVADLVSHFKRPKAESEPAKPRNTVPKPPNPFVKNL